MARKELKEAIQYSYSSKKKSLATFSSSFLVFLLLLWASNPTQASRTISYGLEFIDNAVIILAHGSLETLGIPGFALLLFYSLMSGITLTSIGGQIKHNGLVNSAKAGGIAPGIIASGCAGCGTGLLSLIGATSAITLMPFNGNLVRLIGLIPLIYFLNKSGDPRTCPIPSS